MNAPLKRPRRSKVDRQRIWRLGLEVSPEYLHGNARHDEPVWVMWGLLRHAVRVSNRAFPAPPRSGYPSASVEALFTRDDITPHQQLAAYLRGELDKVEDHRPRPPMPDAFEVTATYEILDLFHHHALRGAWDWQRQRDAVWRLARGERIARVHRETGIGRGRIRHIREAAMADMLAAWGWPWD